METRIILLKILPFILFLMLGYFSAESQTGYLRDTLQATDSTLLLPASVLHPSLVTVYKPDGRKLTDSTDYLLKYPEVILLLHPQDFGDTFIVRRQILSPILTRPFTWIDTLEVKSDYLTRSIPTGLENETSFPTWSDISYSGHFGRGLTIGNVQNATLSSNFDLQLQGTLPHGIEVTGTLSDNSIPIQPEGNSQRLQEFDKVFIRLRKDNAELIAGDHEIYHPDNHFMKYYKKTRGVAGSVRSETDGGWIQESSANYSVSKGKFKRISLEAEEGNQGPYRLSETGNNLFVVVLAGTERVYLDGELLQRGQLNDYTIDYNLGEITFTPQRYISATSRIVIEYEFAEQNYLRSLFTGNTRWEKNNWSLGLMVYSEQDSKNAYQNNLLTPENEAILAEAGREVENLQGSSVVAWEDGYEEGVVLYQMIDTLGYEKVLKLVKKPRNTPLYTATFSYVGEGNGDYRPDESFTNGEVFHWVAPDPDGQSNGNYAPVTRLQAPESQQMFGFNFQKEWDPQTRIFSDWALTRENVNRFSRAPESHTTGWAQRSGFSWGNTPDTIRHRAWQISGEWEWTRSDFQPVSPYRPVEFQRDWNYRQEDGFTGDEQLYTLAAQYQDGGFDGQYTFRRLTSENRFSGNMHDLAVQWVGKKWKARIKESLLSSRAVENEAVFSRPEIQISLFPGTGQETEWGGGYEGEYNADRHHLTDTLTPAAIRFDKFYTFFKWQDYGQITFSSRTDYLTEEEKFLRAFRSDDIRLNSRLSGERNSIEWIGTLRHLKVMDDRSPVEDRQRGWNLLGQLLFSSQWFNSGWTNNGELSLANGKEPQRQFQYIRVETGKGQYKHVDLNGDSIQQLNEFFPAVFPDERQYIRVSTLENTLISTFNYSFKWAANIRLSKWTEHRFWSKWAAENSLLIDNKQLREDRIHLWNIPDSALISSRRNALINLYYNRRGQKFQEHLGYWVRRQKDFLNSGSEGYGTREWFSKSTVLYSGSSQSLWEVRHTLTEQKAETFSEKNFRIRSWDLSHKFRWLPRSTWQLEYKTAFFRGRQTTGEVKASSWSHEFSGQFRPGTDWTIQSSVDLTRIKYEDTAGNPALEQVILEGLQAGQNYIWELNVQRRLPNDLVISLRYNGRKSGLRGVVHQGSVQANLLF